MNDGVLVINNDGSLATSAAVGFGVYIFTGVAEANALRVYHSGSTCTVTMVSGTLGSNADGGYYYGTVKFSIPSSCAGMSLSIATLSSASSGVNRLAVEPDSARTWCLDPCLSAHAVSYTHLTLPTKA